MSLLTAPEHDPGRVVRIDDKYRLDEGTVFLSGIQALVRVLLQQHRADARNGLRTATFVSGYQGSPLGGFDQEVGRLRELADEHALRLVPGLNEELAATAVYGSQLAQGLPSPRYDGVLGVWYGKNPGLDRAMDALRHANFAGTHPQGGALALVGDDPSCKSSTLPSAAEATLAALHVPTFFPGSLQEVLDLGAHAIACSRTSGLWSALKLVTSVADAAGTVRVAPDRVVPRIPTVEWEGVPYRHQPSGDLLAPASLALERTLFGPRLELARRYVADNGLNPVTGAQRGAWLGIVAAGKTFHDLTQALHDLGLEDSELERRGVRLLKVGALYPHDRPTFARFADGLEEIVVVEEKLPYLETALRDALYGSSRPPRILGKRDEHGAPLLAPEAELDADAIAVAVASRLVRRVALESVAARLELIEARRARRRALPMLARTPFFCSGCPHNSSTANPDDTLFGAGIGCHTMVMLAPLGKGTFTGITQMGGEGAQFVGMQPYADADHVVQNLGDGTFHHSGSLAVRFAVAAGVNVTYKLLYNETVAMTGGQDVLGQLSVPDLTRWLALEGVKRIVVTTEAPDRYRGVALDPIARLVDRLALPEAQAELAGVRGVTVLIHDQACAAEQRRLRKRGKLPTPPERIFIDERVCEGCGDCGEKSSCLSVMPVETEFGRKTQIHQASCNKDFSCIEGDCPSFLEVVGGEPPAKRAAPAPPADLPEPSLRVPENDFRVRMPGVGGTGVVTVSQVLQMAAHLDGRHAFGIDQTGLSQKGGPVLSDVRISSAAITGSSKAGSGQADLLLGFDVLGAANPATLQAAEPSRTVAVVSTSVTPTAAMITDTAVHFPAGERNLAAIDAATRPGENVFLDAQALAEALFHDPLPANLLLLGVAFQHGCVPVSAASLEQAIRLNGAGVESNLAAFDWGRTAVARPELVRGLLEPSVPETASDARADAILDGLDAVGELREVLEVRIVELVAYQSPRYARTYADEVVRVAAVERERGAPGETAVAVAYARGLHKLMAYKDEYEVARLHLGSIERARRTGDLGEGAKVSFLLHPPLLRALGLKRKLKLHRGAIPAFRALHAMRRLRGTLLDPFGPAGLRRLERALVVEYRELVGRSLDRLRPDTHAIVAEIAELPDLVRGYEDVKLRSVERFRAEAARLEAELAS